ncbi:MCP four helix bundle domain-containing protein, partial [Thermomicrobiaceae bacterium CFH 74404]
MQLSLQQKLLGLIAGLLVATLIVAVVGWNGLRQTQGEVNQVATDTASMDQLARLTHQMLSVRTAVLKHIMVQDQATKGQLDSEIAQLDQEIGQIFDEWEAADPGGKYRDVREQLASAWAAYVETRDNVALAASRRFDTVAATQAVNGELAQRFAAVDDAITEARQQMRAQTEVSVTSAHSTVSRSELILLGVTLGAAVLGIAVGILLTRPIVRAAQAIAGVSEQLAARDLVSLEQALQRLAQGDLTADFAVDAQPIPVSGRDELGRAAQAFNRMLERLGQVGAAFGQTITGLNQLVAQVRGAVIAVNQAGDQSLQLAGQIAGATQAVAQTIQDVAQGSAQQAEQVTTASTATAEMAQTIEAVAKAAQEQGRALQRAAELAQTIAEHNQQLEQIARQVVDSATHNAQQAQTGAQTVEQSMAAMLRVRTQVEETAHTMRALGEQSQQIGRIVQTIEDLTEQTNLLALNAAI